MVQDELIDIYIYIYELTVSEIQRKSIVYPASTSLRMRPLSILIHWLYGLAAAVIRGKKPMIGYANTPLSSFLWEHGLVKSLQCICKTRPSSYFHGWQSGRLAAPLP